MIRIWEPEKRIKHEGRIYYGFACETLEEYQEFPSVLDYHSEQFYLIGWTGKHGFVWYHDCPKVLARRLPMQYLFNAYSKNAKPIYSFLNKKDK